MSQKTQSQSNVMTAARQTTAAWSRVIETPQEIPAVYKRIFDRSFDIAKGFPFVLLTPAIDHYAHKTTETLTCDTEDALFIFEKNGEQVDMQCYPYRDVYSLEVGSILLYSWLTVRGSNSEGIPAVSIIEFNTTSKRHFEAILRKLRPAFESMDKVKTAAEKDKFNGLSDVNFKFMNYGRESVLPGETVLQFILQPELRQPLFTLFGKTFHKTLALTHMIVVTDRELILISDTGSPKERRSDRYGGIWHYIPLHGVDSVFITEVENERVTLSVRCRPDQTIKILFDISALPELEQFCSQIRTQTESTRMPA